MAGIRGFELETAITKAWHLQSVQDAPSHSRRTSFEPLREVDSTLRRASYHNRATS